MASKRGVRRRACQGKRAYSTPFEAQRAANRTALRYGEPMLRAYRCDFSPPRHPHWHVGHPRGVDWARIEAKGVMV